jgi:hypothetical protein
MPGGALIPISLDLIGERAASLYRWLLKGPLGGRKSVGDVVGRLFEAYLDDQLTSTLGDTHRVLGEAEIRAVLGDDSRCDLIVVHGSEWLFLEVSLQTLSRGIAAGNVAALDSG